MDDKEDIYKVDDEEDYKIDKKSDGDDFKNKMIKYAIIGFVALIILLLLVAFFFPKGKKKESTAVEKEITLSSGEKYSLDYSKGTYTWTSSNQSIARVSDNGEIVGVKNGDSTITIKTKDETITYKVHVEKVENSVTITNIKMEKNTIELEKGKEYEMKVSLTPSDATSKDLTWSSSDEKVAKVKDGVITAVAPGTCMITVQTTNGNIDTCLVKVKGDGNYNPINSIKITSSDVSLNKGTSYSLTYEVSPEGSDNLITWESSNNEVATVENGVVYALKGGEIEVSAVSGDIKEVIKVKVNEEKIEPNFILNQTSIGLDAGDTYTLSLNNNTQVTWSSANSNIATVDSTGKVTAKSAGGTTISATDSTGYKVDCKVTVTKKEASKQEDVVTLNTSTLAMNVGDSFRLYETVTPSNNVSGVTWSSSDTKIATVVNGEVRGVSNGTATITAKLANGSHAECVVTVSAKIINAALVKINASSMTLKVGTSNQLTATVLPSNTTNKTINWSSSNNDVATVDSKGKVTGKKKGSAIIYARTSNGVFDTCTVIVN